MHSHIAYKESAKNFSPDRHNVLDHSQEDWQVRIAIAPRDITRAVGILRDTLDDANFDWKYFSIPEDIQAKLDAGSTDIYDAQLHGMFISANDRDRDQRAKTISIYLPQIASMSEKMTPDKYGAHIKKLLLDCWQLLKEYGIEVVYNTPLGDKSICVDGIIPTPFSITANKPYNFPQGILHQKHHNPLGYDDPSHLFEISSADLSDYHIIHDADIAFSSQKDRLIPDTRTGIGYIINEHDRIKALPSLLRMIQNEQKFKACKEAVKDCTIANAEEVYGTLCNYLMPLLERYPKPYENGIAIDHEAINKIRVYLGRFESLLEAKKAEQERGASSQASPLEEGFNLLSEEKAQKEIAESSEILPLALRFNAFIEYLSVEFNDPSRIQASLVTLIEELPQRTEDAMHDFSVKFNGLDFQAHWQKDPAAMQRLHFSMHHYQYAAHAYANSKRMQKWQERLTLAENQHTYLDSKADLKVLIQGLRSFLNALPSELSEEEAALEKECFDFTKKLSEGTATVEAMFEFKDKLSDFIQSDETVNAATKKSTLSTKIKIIIGAVVGLIVGAILGAIAGAIATAWAGGAGGFVGAITGCVLGVKIGIGIGAGMGLGCGLLACYGLFKAKAAEELEPLVEAEDAQRGHASSPYEPFNSPYEPANRERMRAFLPIIGYPFG